MKYSVSVRIDGFMDYEIEANNFEEAMEAATEKAKNADWNCMEDIDINATYAKDENGKTVEY